MNMITKPKIKLINPLSFLLVILLFNRCSSPLNSLPEETIRITPIDFYSKESLTVFEHCGVINPAVYKIDYNTRLKGIAYLEVWRDSVRSKIYICEFNHSSDSTIAREGSFQVEVSYKEVPVKEPARHGKIKIKNFARFPNATRGSREKEIEFEILERFNGEFTRHVQSNYLDFKPKRLPSVTYNIDLEKNVRYYYEYLEKYGDGTFHQLRLIAKNLDKKFVNKERKRRYSSSEEYQRRYNDAFLNTSLSVVLRVEFFERGDNMRN